MLTADFVHDTETDEDEASVKAEEDADGEDEWYPDAVPEARSLPSAPFNSPTARNARPNRQSAARTEGTPNLNLVLMSANSLTGPCSFFIFQEEFVVRYLYNRFRQFGQPALKKIAEFSIDAICPKKQTRYPYGDDDNEKEVPLWWPSEEVSRFRGPHHMNMYGMKSSRASVSGHADSVKSEPLW